MAITKVIDPIPDAPSRSDPENFDERADAFLERLETLDDDLNEWANQCNQTQNEINQARDDAISARDDAQTYRDQAQGYRDEALTYRNEAESFAQTAVNAPGTNATSTTSLSLSTGTKSLTIQTNKEFIPGMHVIIAYQNDPNIYMYGVITSYNKNTGALEVNVHDYSGSGTYSAWNISLSGPMPDVGVAMTKTFYVDVVNGNDNNDGSFAAPFKTLKKAIDSVPTGGYGSIVLIGSGDLNNPVEYIITDEILIFNKQIVIGCSTTSVGAVIKPVVVFNGGYNYVRGFTLFNSLLRISTRDGNLKIQNAPKADDNYDFAWRRSGIINIVGDSTVVIGDYPIADGVILNNGGCHLINVCLRDERVSMGHIAFLYVRIVFDTTTPDVMAVNLYGPSVTASLSAHEVSLKDSLGNAVSWSNVIAGVVKDANGIPLNLISNLDFTDGKVFAESSLSNVSDSTILDKIKNVDGSGSGLDADLLDGYHAGNSSGQIPVSNGTVNTNLNADLLDGYHAGNSSGQIPISNGTVCTNLNADMWDGGHKYISSDDPSGGNDGDIWFQI